MSRPCCVGRATKPEACWVFTSSACRAAHDWAGRPWADEWYPITFLKRSKPGEGEGLYERARAMEAAKYGVGGGVAPEAAAGTRCSPRLVEMQGEMG